ncbi:LacI family DNA-binding transcriptional regulator [Labrys wisconsinensis]|uniref:DNA-binding LacI/PurR family transcriptional regulator n=1 Tax=Labrys wisconsinensis TaxID=425677 RepID=A0ABU0JJB9_9HYPH|nr:substrate-binding domain-containing protein [Labrys wisconsinensis]MDQ0474381.1 DNA-binding LacI/PurR family transcriptional regulator [Labrys wisconsinensis]
MAGDGIEDGASEQRTPLTGRQLAKALGISQSTISRAFSEGATISPTMRAKVLEAARELGYQPNVIARSLTTRRSGIVGILTANLANPFYVSVLAPLTRRLQQMGLQALLFSVPSGQQIDAQLPRLLQYNVDAVVVTTGTISESMARRWAEAGRMVLPFSYTIPDLDLPSVSCDNEAGGRAIAQHLIQLGHRRPAFVGGRPDSATSIARGRGFAAALAEHGVPLFGRLDTGEYTYEGGYAAALELGRTRPDAIFFADDIMALGGMDALRFGLGLKVPQDISVVGFDNIPLAAWPTYALTTFAQPVETMIEAAVRLLTRRDGEAAGRPVLLPGALVQRGSVQARGR